MIRQPLRRRDDMRGRKVLAAAGVAALVAVTSCGVSADWIGPGGGCSSPCETAAWVIPYAANILRGDTVRFIACNDYTKCGNPTDTGTVVSKWSVPDSNLVTLAKGTSAVLVPAATSVLVRGVAAGRTNLSVTFSKGTNYAPAQTIRVADSTDIKSIELPMYGLSDTLRVNEVRYFGVQLRDVGGIIYRGAPTSLSASDATVLKVTQQTISIGYSPYPGAIDLKVVALKAGKASFTATFLGLTATRQLTVVP